MLQWFRKSNKLIGYHGFKWHLFELRVLYEAEWTPVNWITCYSVIGNQGNALSLFYKHHLLSEWNRVSFSSSAVSGSSTEHNFTKLNSHQSVFTSDFEIVQSNVNQTLHFFWIDSWLNALVALPLISNGNEKSRCNTEWRICKSYFISNCPISVPTSNFIYIFVLYIYIY